MLGKHSSTSLRPSTCTTPGREEACRRGRSRVLPVRSKTARRVVARIVVAWLPCVGEPINQNMNIINAIGCNKKSFTTLALHSVWAVDASHESHLRITTHKTHIYHIQFHNERPPKIPVGLEKSWAPSPGRVRRNVIRSTWAKIRLVYWVALGLGYWIYKTNPSSFIFKMLPYKGIKINSLYVFPL